MIEEKEEHKKNMQLLAYCGAVAAGIALLFGVHTMLDSTARIRKMSWPLSAPASAAAAMRSAGN